MSLPRWRELTGFNPLNEHRLSAEQRDAGIRRLLKEVERCARLDFARADAAPPGERSIYWDPIDGICGFLEISRVKLSDYARQLTGLRAHELTDRIKAETLPAQLEAQLHPFVQAQLGEMLRSMASARLQEPDLAAELTQNLARRRRLERHAPFKAGFAVTLGFPNPSRLNRACLLAHRVSLDELEYRLISTMVQKFLDAARAGQPLASVAATPARATIKEGAARREIVPESAPVSPETQAIIDDAVQHVLKRREARVA